MIIHRKRRHRAVPGRPLRTQSAAPSCAARTSKQSDGVDPQVAAVVGIDDAERAARVRAADAPPLGRGELLMIGEVRARDVTAELVARTVREHRYAAADGERLGEIGPSGVVPRRPSGCS